LKYTFRLYKGAKKNEVNKNSGKHHRDLEPDICEHKPRMDGHDRSKSEFGAHL
jgi:hypothetical protein